MHLEDYGKERRMSEISIQVRHYCVEGRVQGVGFRWFVHREAAELGLRGAVRNTESGAVEVMAAGMPAELDRLRAALERGSRGSRVDRVLEEELPPTHAEALGAFTIEGAW
jgi:acylphosphatase